MSRKITFKSLRRGTTYVLTIADGSNTVIDLTPSATPFVTDMDNSDDFFTPVRAQSGTIEILGEVSDVEPLLTADPVSRLVTLNGMEGSTTTLRWKGYLQTAALSQTWDKGPIAISLPVVSHLGIIESYNFEQAGYVRFAALFKSLSECTGTAFYTSFVFPNITDIATILKYHFSGQAFAEWDDMKLVYNYSSYKHVLEEICKLFGWVAIEVADQLCFVAPDLTAGYVQFSASDIATLATGGTATGATLAQSILVEKIDGAGHNIDYLPGKKKVKVSATPGNSFGNLFKFDTKNYAIRSTEGHSRPHKAGSSEYDHYWTKNYGDSTEIEVTYNGNIRYDNFYYQNESLRYGSSCVTERQLSIDSAVTPSPVVSDFGWISHIVCHSAPSGTDICSVHPARKHYASGLMGDMYIQIKFTIMQSKGYNQEWEPYTGNIGMKVLLDDTVLMDSSVWVEEGLPYYHQSGYANADSCVAIIPGNTTGNLHIQFSIPVVLYVNMYHSIQDLEITYANDWRRHVNDPLSENVSEYDINNGFTESLEQSNVLTTQRPEFANQITSEQIGWGLVLDDSLAPIMKIYGTLYPEDALAQRMRDHYSVSKKRITAQLRSRGGLFSPLHLHVPGSGSGMVCLFQSVNWRDDKIEAALYEI